MPAITDTVTGQIILAFWAIFIVFWFVTAFFVKKTVEDRGGMGNGILIRMAIAIVVILAASQHWSILSMRLWAYSPTAGIIADIVAGCGLTLLLWSRVMLGRNWSASVVLKEDHELVQRGPYAVVRHPIYSGLSLLFLGEALWYGNAAWIAVFIAVFVSFYLKSQKEEELMTQHFPQEYPAYKARTKAIIPFVL